MFIIWLLLFVTGLVKTNQITTLEKNKSLQITIPSKSTFQLTIQPSQFQFIFLQLDSCNLELIQVSTSKQIIIPSNQDQFSNFYKIEKSEIKVSINYARIPFSSNLTILGFDSYSNFPNNKRNVDSSLTDEKLMIDFAPVSIYNTVVQCSYVVQFQIYSDCKNKDVQHVIGEILIPSSISNNLTNISLQIPRHIKYARDLPFYTYNKLDKIQQMIASGVDLEVNVYAKITKPIIMNMNYKRKLVQTSKIMKSFKTGLLIVSVTIILYYAVAHVYQRYHKADRMPINLDARAQYNQSSLSIPEMGHKTSETQDQPI